MTRPPLPSTESLRVGSPASQVLLTAPTSRRPSRLTSFPSLGGTSASSVHSLPLAARRSSLGPGGLCHPAPPMRRVSLRGGDWISQVPGNPLVYVPCSLTPACFCARSLRRFGIAFRSVKSVGLRQDCLFGAQSHGPHTRCLRFAATVSRVHARLASGWRPTLAGRDWLPAGFKRTPDPVFDYGIGSLLCQASPGALTGDIRTRGLQISGCLIPGST